MSITVLMSQRFYSVARLSWAMSKFAAGIENGLVKKQSRLHIYNLEHSKEIKLLELLELFFHSRVFLEPHIYEKGITSPVHLQP